MNEITLKESNKIKIFNRIENKYLLNESSFQIIYNFLLSNYLKVRFNDLYWLHYHSLYYDTNNMKMYHDHLNDIENRMKIRIREYQDGTKFLEVKKNIQSRSIKKRFNVYSLELNDDVKDFIMFDTKDLYKILDVKYERISFISKELNERVTCDRNIEFYNYTNNINHKFDTSKYVLEVKKSLDNPSMVEQFINHLGIQSTAFSKYFNGINLTCR